MGCMHTCSMCAFGVFQKPQEENGEQTSAVSLPNSRFPPLIVPTIHHRPTLLSWHNDVCHLSNRTLPGPNVCVGANRGVCMCVRICVCKQAHVFLCVGQSFLLPLRSTPPGKEEGSEGWRVRRREKNRQKEEDYWCWVSECVRGGLVSLMFWLATFHIPPWPIGRKTALTSDIDIVTLNSILYTITHTSHHK